MNASPAGLPSGFRWLRLLDVRRESAAIASFRLEPVETDAWVPFRPGQFLVFRVPEPNAPGGYALRSYSISGPSDGRSYRVSIKREALPGGRDGAGVGSGYFHHRFRPGDAIAASAPRGEFVLDEASSRAVLLLSGGVGLTPVLAMLHRLTETSDRRVHFVHACENGANHALFDEVETLASRRPDVHAAFVYRSPDADDAARKRHVASGLVTRELLQRLLPLDDYDIYLCGPPPFMQAMRELLIVLGIRPERIATEFFGATTTLGANTTLPSVAEPSTGSAPALSGDGFRVSFHRSGRAANWSESAGSLLDLAEAAGLSPPFSCRSGVCMTCSAKLVAGEVEYSEEPLDKPPNGEILLCCTRPSGDVVLGI